MIETSMEKNTETDMITDVINQNHTTYIKKSANGSPSSGTMIIINDPDLSPVHSEKCLKGHSVPANLENVYDACRSGPSTIILGSILNTQDDTDFTLVSCEELSCQDGHITPQGAYVVAKTHAPIVPAPVICLVRDANEATPSDYRDIGLQKGIELLSILIPEVFPCSCGYVYSSSDLIAPDGSILSQRSHIYIQIADPSDLDRFKEILIFRCIEAGLYWYRDISDNIKIIEYPFDFKAIRPEWLFYESQHHSDPILCNGLILDTRAIPSPSKDCYDKVLKEKEIFVPKTETSSFEVKFLTSCLQTQIDSCTLKADTEITYSDGRKTTVRQFIQSGLKKIPCYSPFRDDRTPNAFVSIYSDRKDSCFVYDKETNTAYFYSAALDTSPIPSISMKESICTLENTRDFLTHHGIKCRYDMIKKDIDIILPPSCPIPTPDNMKSVAYTVISNFAVKASYNIPKGVLKSHIQTLADIDAFNPVFEWMNIVWDGIDRFEALASKIKVDKDNEAYRDLILKYWCIQAVAAVAGSNRHGQKLELVLIFVGAQGIGKTTFLKSLAPDWILDGHVLITHDKDSVKTACSHWIVELGELDATFKKNDPAYLKSFLSKDEDLLRMPYKQEFSTYPRRTVFCASVNKSDFLIDRTGNRRYGVIEVEDIDNATQVNMQQYWAQVLTWYKEGETWWLTPEEMDLQTVNNSYHEAHSSIKQRILDTFDFTKINTPPDDTWLKLSAKDVLKAIGEEGSISNSTSVGTYLTQMGIPKKKTNGSMKYMMPPRKAISS